MQSCKPGGSEACNQLKPNTDRSSVYMQSPANGTQSYGRFATTSSGAGPPPMIPKEYKDNYVSESSKKKRTARPRRGIIWNTRPSLSEKIK